MFRNAHAEMVGVQRENRAANDSRRRAAEANRVEEARQSSAARSGSLAGVRGQVDTLRAGVSRLRGEFAADMAGAHRVWGGAMTSQEAKAKRPAPVKVDQKSEDKGLQPLVQPDGTKTASVLVRERTKAEQRPAEKAADAAPDDLTGIPGIGRSTQEHLNDAGIRTYAELAACNPGYLRTILEGSGRRGNVEEWIAEAAKLVKSESRAHRG
jgi:predicted flap endonuclease-1-like 5' DNA nuclease